MKTWTVIAFFISLFVTFATADAQIIQSPDTSNTSLKKDSTLANPIQPIKTEKTNIDGQLKSLNPASKVSQIKNGISENQNKVSSAFKNSMSGLKPSPVTLNLYLGNQTLYQPAPFTGINNNQRFVNAFSLTGTGRAWIVPLNFNFSTNRNVTNAAALGSSLFKFDFNSRMFTDLFQSDLQQYQSLRMNSFAGLSLTDYTRNIALQQLSTEEGKIKSVPLNSNLSNYLSDSQKIGQLLNMSKDQIRDRLLAEAARNKKSLSDSLLNHSEEKIGSNNTSQSLNSAFQIKQNTINSLSENSGLSQYINDPNHTEELRLMTPEQIENKLEEVAAGDAKYKKQKDLVFFPVEEANYLKPLVAKIVEQQTAFQKESVQKIANSVFVTSRKGGVPQLSQIVNQQLSDLNTIGLPASGTKVLQLTNKRMTERSVDSVASAISNIKTQLQTQGYDLKKMLEMQELLDAGKGNLGTSETASNFFNKKPQNNLQNVFSNVQAFQLGAFAGKAPGGTDGQDLFMTGTALTYKADGIPITAGYGTTNSIGSLKDASFQTSVFDPPKYVTFIGAQVNRGFLGKVNLAFSSSVNRELSNSNYSVSTISTNTVAFTLTKDVKIPVIGDFTFNASKSAALNNNNYQAGIQPVLDKQNGLNNDLSTNLFQSVEFGVNQRLDIKQLDMSDNVYFSYSGMGYQNPANTGFGGAKMKFGGNVKKSFYNRKLMLTLRSDLNNMPISYTSNDKWKNYQIQLDSRYALTRKINISFKYSTNSTSKTVDDISTPVYSFQKIQLDGNASYKIGKYFSVSHLSIGEQAFSNSYQSLAGGNLLLINYTQSVVINRNTVSANIFYNKELSAFQVIGNMLTSDVAFSYMLFDKLSLSSGLTYLDNKGIAKQAGIKQSIQLFSLKNFSLDTYVDLSKNLITPLYPELYASCRAELSLKYHIKN